MRKTFRSPVFLSQIGEACNVQVPIWAEKVIISGVADRPDEAEDGDITIATTSKEVGDVYLSMAAACVTTEEYLSSLPRNGEIASIAVDNPKEVIKKIGDSF